SLRLPQPPSGPLAIVHPVGQGTSFPAKSRIMPATVYHQSLARPYRKSLLVALLIITFLSGLLFAWINIGRANYPVAVVELLMAGYSMILLLALRHAKRLERWILAYLLPFFTVMMIALAAPRSTLNVFICVLLIPLVAHLLLGRRSGLAMSWFYKM